jgi:hypothetical protein
MVQRIRVPPRQAAKARLVLPLLCSRRRFRLRRRRRTDFRYFQEQEWSSKCLTGIGWAITTRSARSAAHGFDGFDRTLDACIAHGPSKAASPRLDVDRTRPALASSQDRVLYVACRMSYAACCIAALSLSVEDGTGVDRCADGDRPLR